MTYPQDATPEWVDKVAERVAKLTSHFIERDHNSEFLPPLTQEKLAHSQDQLQRTAKGFIAEFLRQTRDRVSNLNQDIYYLYYPAAEKRESKPGTFHAAASVKWMLEKDISEAQATRVLSKIIEYSVKAFHKEYRKIDPSLPPEASINKKMLNEIIRRATASIDAEVRRS